MIFPWSIWSKWFGNQWNALKYFWFTSREQSNSPISEEKQNFCIFIEVSKQRKWKKTKSFIIDVWYGYKCTPEVVQDSKINLKWMNTKTVFLQCGPYRGYYYIGISQDIRSNSLHMYYYIVILTNLVKFTGTHFHRGLFSTCNLQLHWKRDAGTWSFLWVFRNFLGTLLL